MHFVIPGKEEPAFRRPKNHQKTYCLFAWFKMIKISLRAILLFTAVLLAGAFPVHALPALPPYIHMPYIHVPFAAAVPALTGDLEDPAWKAAAIIPSMTVSSGPAAQRLTALPTRVYLLWNEKYLYIRFICQGGSVRSPYKKHDDPLWKADAVEVFVDPKGDARQWMELEVSPNNVVFDQLAVLTAEPQYDDNGVLTDLVLSRDWWTDPSWNLDGLRTATKRLPSRGAATGWVVDIAIPADPLLRRLGVKSFTPMHLRANLLRYETMAGADGKSVFIPMNWAPVAFGCPHISPDKMGTWLLDPASVAQ